MKRSFLLFALCAVLLVTLPAQAQEWKAATTMKKLPNGLTVVVSEDHSAPTFGICVSYGIGFRLEPEGRDRFRASLRAHDVRRHAGRAQGHL